MSNDINLYYNKRTQSRDNQKIVKWLQIGAFSCLVIVLISAITIAILKTTSAQKSLQDEQAQLLQQLKSEEKKIASLFLISERLKGISDLVSKRFDFNTILTFFLNQIPSDVTIDSLAINSKKLTLTISSNSLFSVEQSFDQLGKLVNSNKRFRRINMEDFSVDYRDGKYSVTLIAEIL